MRSPNKDFFSFKGGFLYGMSIYNLYEYVEIFSIPPQVYQSCQEFKIRSYFDFTINELLSRIYTEELRPPPYITGREPIPIMDIINDFIDEIDYYFELAKTENTKILFSVMLNIGRDILIYLKGNKNE